MSPACRRAPTRSAARSRVQAARAARRRADRRRNAGDQPVARAWATLDDEIDFVVGGGASVNTQTSELSYLVSEQAIETLPLNGRNYTDLALLQPGVLAFPHRDGGSVVAHGLGMSINGQDPRSNVYLLDGTLQNDFTNGPAGSAAGTALGVESIREFRVEVNAYSAEFGRNSGGQINVLTKSGTNGLHGSAYEFHRNDALDARNYFDPAEKPDFTRNQFGGIARRPDRARQAVLLRQLRIAARAPRPHGLDVRARRQRAPRHPAESGRAGTTITVPVQPARRAVSERISARERPGARRRARGLSLPVPSDDRSALPAGSHRLQPRGRPAVVRALHVRQRESVPADRLSAVSAHVPVEEPVLHR